MTYRIKESDFEKIKRCNFYKRHLFGKYHLGTIYGVAGDKSCSLWKRILSHVYVVICAEIIPDDFYEKEREKQCQK